MRISVIDTQEKILTKVLMLKGEKGDKGDAGELTNLDTALSTTSTNAVQNKVITNALNTLTENSATNSFTDGIDSLFKDVTGTIVPIQAGSGTPSPTNVRTISGYTNLIVTNTGDTTNTITIPIGQTVYSGSFTISGKKCDITLDKKMFTDNGSMNWSSTTNGFVLSVADSGINDCKNAGTTSTPIVCNISEQATRVWQDGKIGIDFRTIWIGDSDKSIYTDVAGLKAFLSTNPIQILYPLATPITISLDIDAFKSLEGTNNITVNTGSITNTVYITNETIAWLLDLINA